MVKKKINFRTDLALEVNEEVGQTDGKLKGIVINENLYSKKEIRTTELRITNKMGEMVLGKPKGTYITVEISDFSKLKKTDEYRLEKIISTYIYKLLINLTSKKDIKVLVVGLGNRNITSDSLGPIVFDELMINMTLEKINTKPKGVCAICPGVMAETGIETATIVKGVVRELKPDVVIAIDALAARNIKRLCKTVQICDSGINPGSGVGNHRLGLNKSILNVPVLGIGVPTVIDAVTIVNDSINSLARNSGVLRNNLDLGDMNDMYVTPKDIDLNVKYLGKIIAKSINRVNNHICN